MSSAAARPEAGTAPGLRIALTREAVGYGLVTLVAFGLRAPRLGLPPLSEAEAGQAMAALRFLAGEVPAPGLVSSPLTFGGAVVSFALLGASDAAARLLPLVAGLGLVMLPLAFRREFGRLPMLAASALLALSPGAVAASRSVDGSGAAVLCLLLAVRAVWNYTDSRSTRALAAGGVWLGLGLLADFSTLLGLTGLLLGLGALVMGDEQGRARAAVRAAVRDAPWRAMAAWLAGTLFLVSTLMLTTPRGLGSAADLLSRFARGVVTRPQGTPFVAGLLLLYEPVIVFFGLIGMARGLTSDVGQIRFVSGWAAGALVLTAVYPGALPPHVVWPAVPLATLAGLALADVLATPTHGPGWSAALLAALVAAMLLVAALWAVSFVTLTVVFGEAVPTLLLRLGLVGSVGLLAALTTYLWSSIWGWANAWRGLALGLLGLGLLVALNGSVALAYTRATDPREPWHVAPGQPALDALAATAREVSEVATGDAHAATLSVQGSPDGLLAWTLRDFPAVTFVETPGPQVTSDIVVTLAEADLALGERYVGQDFVVVRSWRPAGLSFDRALRWLMLREADTPTGDQRVILWVREDLYTLLPNEVRQAPPI